MAWSADFLAKIRNQVNYPNLELTLDGVEYQDEVNSVSQIVRSASLQAGIATVVVNNSAGTFNGRITDDTWDQQRQYVKINFDGLAEDMNLLAGIVSKIEYQGARATIYIRDHLAQMLNRSVGDWATEVDYYSGAAPHAGDGYSPAWLVWYILTTSAYGNLDNTAGAGNTDIDWTSFSNWATDCATANYALKGKFTGEMTIRDIILRVCELTDSYAWVNADGKFEFAVHDGANQPAGSESYDDDLIIPEDESNTPFLVIDTDHIRNELISWWGYDPTADEPEKSATRAIGTDAGSQGQYGEFHYMDMDRNIWHANATSHSSYRAAWVARFAGPRRVVRFEAQMPSWLEDIGHTVSVTNSLLGISSETMTIIKMILLPDKGHTLMTLYWDWD